MKSSLRTLLLTCVIVLSVVIASAYAADGDVTLLFDFDDGVLDWGNWTLDGVTMRMELSDDNAIPGKSGYSLKFSADGNDVPNAHCSVHASGLTIPMGTKAISFWAKYISGEAELIFLSTEIFGTRIQNRFHLPIHDMDSTVENKPEGATVEKKENGWYKITLDLTDVKYVLEWDPNGKIDFPLKETTFQLYLPTNGTCVLIDQIEYIR